MDETKFKGLHTHVTTNARLGRGIVFNERLQLRSGCAFVAISEAGNVADNLADVKKSRVGAKNQTDVGAG